MQKNWNHDIPNKKTLQTTEMPNDSRPVLTIEVVRHLRGNRLFKLLRKIERVHIIVYEKNIDEYLLQFQQHILFHQYFVSFCFKALS